MTERNGSKRVTCKRRHPNQLFHELLESLYQDAVENNSSIVPSLKEALTSLAKYPLPLSSGAECAILKGFDKRLCRYIDGHLKGKKAKLSDTEIYTKELSDSEMTSKPKKNSKKKRDLETNTGRCQFNTQFGASQQRNAVREASVGCKSSTMDAQVPASQKKTAEQEVPVQSRNSTKDAEVPNQKAEKNNNTATVLHIKGSEPLLLSTYFVSRSIKDSGNMQNIEEPHNVDFNFSENWDSLNDDHQSTSRGEVRAQCQPIVVTDDSEDDEPVAEIDLSGDDETIDEYDKQCIYNEETVYEPAESNRNEMQLYYEDKTKQDAEELAKIRKWASKMYKPAYRSGAYAILVALHEQCNECPYRDCLTKEELIQKAQKHTDESFTHPKPESSYTAWTNAKRLINKGMIEIKNLVDKNEDFYMLTALGAAVAMELVKENSPTVTVNDVIFHGQRNNRVPSLEEVVLVPPPPIATVDEEQSSVFIEMPPGTFDIVMLIDKREHFDKTLLQSPNYFCRYEARSLTIGDFLWIARSRKTGQELVLPYIVERKRMDDLASSIKDGRFHEQKFRLRKCGLKNVVYLVESYRKNAIYALPPATLMQAVVNTSILEEFNIVKTDSLDHTFRFLGMLSESLAHEFLTIGLRGCNQDTQGRELMTFEFFNKFSCKNKPLTVRDTFIKMLLQLKGLSIEKALAITHKYSTPRLLMKAYDKCTPKEGELLLANLKFNSFTRNVGPGVSKTVYKLFSKGM